MIAAEAPSALAPPARAPRRSRDEDSPRARDVPGGGLRCAGGAALPRSQRARPGRVLQGARLAQQPRVAAERAQLRELPAGERQARRRQRGPARRLHLVGRTLLLTAPAARLAAGRRGGAAAERPAGSGRPDDRDHPIEGLLPPLIPPADELGQAPDHLAVGIVGLEPPPLLLGHRRLEARERL